MKADLKELTRRLRETPPHVLKEREAAAAIDSLIAELARVRAGEPFGWYSAKEDDFMLDKIRKTHERLNSHTHRIGKYDTALFTAPQPAAREPASAVPVVEQFLQDGDQHLLRSFIETTEDDEGYMLTKPEIKRLAELGVVQSHGFGKYSVTMFGHWVHERYWHQNPSLPLKTNTDSTADAAIAAGQQYLKENGK